MCLLPADPRASQWKRAGDAVVLTHPSLLPEMLPAADFNLEEEAKPKRTSHGYKPHVIFQASPMEDFNLEKYFLCQNSITATL